MNHLPENIDPPDRALRKLEQRIKMLEQRLEKTEARVDTLEHPLAARWPRPVAETPSTPAPASPAPASPQQAGSLFPVLGKALLGIAGAYVLRAVEETSVLPRQIVAAAGVVYAFLWLMIAMRVRQGPRIAASIYAATSALILAPMLWELTLRFNVLPAAAAAAVVCAFALAAFAPIVVGSISIRDLRPVLSVVSVAAAALALALAVASHALLPFVIVLLILAAVCELIPGCDRAPEVSVLIALAADAVIWVLIYVYFEGQNAHADFPVLSRGALLVPGIAAFLLSASSATVKTVLHAQPITAFATIQTMVAFLLAAVSLADFGQPHGVRVLGAACLVLCAACYAAVFTVFARAPESGKIVPRNQNIFAIWAAALLLAGNFLFMPPSILVLLLAVAALAAVFLSRQERWKAFEYYGMVFLLAASAASGMPNFLVGALVGTPLIATAPGALLVAVSSLLCYLLAQSRESEPWLPQALHLGFAALAAGAVAALLIRGLLALTALAVIPGAHHLALIRTVALCATALVLVSAGARWRRRELTRLGYAAVLLVAIKLITEDLRHGHLAYIAFAIFLVAFTLIAAPRVARTRQKA